MGAPLTNATTTTTGRRRCRPNTQQGTDPMNETIEARAPIVNADLDLCPSCGGLVAYLGDGLRDAAGRAFCTPDCFRETNEKPFTVDSEGAANWVLKRLAAVEDEARRIKAQTAQRLAELKADGDRLHARFDSELEAFARDEAARRRRKTITLQQGTLSLRAQAERLIITDASEALRHATAHKDEFADAFLSRFDEAAYKALAERAIETTGEMLPGVAREEARDVFTIRTATTPKKNATAGEEE